MSGMDDWEPPPLETVAIRLTFAWVLHRMFWLDIALIDERRSPYFGSMDAEWIPIKEVK